MGGGVAPVGVTPRSLEAVRWQVRDWLQRLPAAVRANDNSTRPALAGRSCSTNPRNRLLRGRCTGWKGRGTTECSAASVISTPSDHVEDWPGTRPGAPAGSSECCLTWAVPTLFLRAAFLYIMGGTEGSQPAGEGCSRDVCHRRAVHRRAGPGLRSGIPSGPHLRKRRGVHRRHRPVLHRHSARARATGRGSRRSQEDRAARVGRRTLHRPSTAEHITDHYGFEKDITKSIKP